MVWLCCLSVGILFMCGVNVLGMLGGYRVGILLMGDGMFVYCLCVLSWGWF